MKHPFWIANSSLFFLFLFVVGFIYVTRSRIPEREPIEPRLYSKPKTKESLHINISKIYENDLFDTYSKQIIPEEVVSVSPFPEPPQPQKAIIPEIPTPQFLDPLDITLKGIIVVGSNNPKNRVIIADNKTTKEATYYVGSTIEDAQVIRIFSNKVILLRSNGQQEILYLREDDAKSDPAYIIQDWEPVIQPLSKNKYVINIQEFTARIHNLGQFIDILGLTTAYKQGKIIGCRVGFLTEKSLGSHLGFQPNDIVISVNNIPTITTDERLNIYKSIIAMHPNDTIKATLLRNEKTIDIEYTLQESFKKVEQEIKGTIGDYSYQEKEKILREKHKFAPTVQEIRKREKQNMMEKGIGSIQSSTAE